MRNNNSTGKGSTMQKSTMSVVELPDQKGFKFYGDKRQALRVFDAMINRLAEKGTPYNTAHVPQADQFLPTNLEKGTREHAIFLFIICLWMRGGVESDTATTFVKALHENRPELFDPFAYSDPNSTREQIASVAEALTEYKLGQRVNENAPGWVYNMRKLARFWNGDPRTLMSDKPRFKDLIRRIKGKTTSDEGFKNEDNPNGFMYFREKMAAMLAYFLMDAGLVGMFYTPVPVDFHVLRLCSTNLIFRIRGMKVKDMVGVDFYRPQNLRIAREITEWYCRKRRVSPVALCDALWLLSRTLCRNNPGNSGYVLDTRRQILASVKKNVELKTDFLFEIEGSVNPRMETSYELFDGPDQIKGRKRYQGLRFNAEELASPGLVRRFEHSCGLCPVSGFCRFNISSGSYYVKGKLLAERLRFIPPQHQTDFLGHADFGEALRPAGDPSVRYSRIYLDDDVSENS